MEIYSQKNKLLANQAILDASTIHGFVQIRSSDGSIGFMVWGQNSLAICTVSGLLLSSDISIRRLCLVALSDWILDATIVPCLIDGENLSHFELLAVTANSHLNRLRVTRPDGVNATQLDESYVPPNQKSGSMMTQPKIRS